LNLEPYLESIQKCRTAIVGLEKATNVPMPITSEDNLSVNSASTSSHEENDDRVSDFEANGSFHSDNHEMSEDESAGAVAKTSRYFSKKYQNIWMAGMYWTLSNMSYFTPTIHCFTAKKHVAMRCICDIAYIV
jgi:hypothetical protein